MADGDFGFDFGGFFDGLVGFFASIISFIVSVLVFLFNLIVAVGIFLFNLVLVVVKFLFDALKIILRGFRHVLSDIFHGRFAHLFKDYLKLKETLKRWFGPLLKWLQRIRLWFDLHVLRPLRMIINVIQRIRQILVIFRIFHLKFAEKIDAFLARLERKLVENVLFLRKVLNQLITLIDLIVNPDLIFRRNVIAATLLSWLGALKRIVGFGSNRALGADEVNSIEQDKALLKPGTKLAEIGSGGGVTFHPALKSILGNLDKEMKDFTPV